MNHSISTLVFSLALLLPACVDQDLTAPAASITQAVIDGEKSPGDLGFTIHPLQENAVVAQLAEKMGKRYQGCTGTLAGDRVVVSAGHCLVENQTQWLAGEEEPTIMTPERVFFVVGPDVNQPLCTLEVESLHLHPEIKPSTKYGIEYDVSVFILKTSVFESCPHVTPIGINREAPTSDHGIDELLQGGYGSLDGSYDFSPLRYWSRVKLSEVDQMAVVIKKIQQGFPTFGDSGSAVSHRFPDGTLRNLGVASWGGGDLMYFSRLDTKTAFLDTVITEQLVCGPAAGEGTCVGDVHLRCAGGAFTQVDCAEEGMACGLDEQGKAGCTCSCDQQPFCEAGCDCDADCACECDLSAGCDQGCACDTTCQGGADGGVTDAETVSADSIIKEEGDSSGCGVAGTPPPAGLLFVLTLLHCMFSRARRPRHW